MERNEGGEVVRRLLPLNPPPHYFSSLNPLHPLPHYLSPSFLSVILTTSKGEKGSEEDDYFNKFPPTMPSVVLENRLIRMFKVSYRSAPKKQHLCSTS
jgi:hypothetical protein